MRYMVKTEQRVEGDWRATLFADPEGAPLVNLHVIVLRDTEAEALKSIREKSKSLAPVLEPAEPKWYTLDDVPEPQSLKAV